VHRQILAQLLVTTDQSTARRSWRHRGCRKPACPWLRNGRSDGSTCSRRSCRPARNGSIRRCPRPSAAPTAQRRRPGSWLATSSAQPLASARNSSFLATKSVSLLTSMIAPSLPSAEMLTPTRLRRECGRGLGGLVAQLDAQDFFGLAMSPSASVRAFLHSIIGASVLPRSSATMLAVIAAILLHLQGRPETLLNFQKQAEGLQRPPLHNLLVLQLPGFRRTRRRRQRQRRFPERPGCGLRGSHRPRRGRRGGWRGKSRRYPE
jgi:hypothetical protein